jgi:predicted small lipoprotein YifL
MKTILISLLIIASLTACGRKGPLEAPPSFADANK